MLRAFPGKGILLKIVHNYPLREYYCDGCQHAGSDFQIACDEIGLPSTRRARCAVYEHFTLHEYPVMDFDGMTDCGRRAWYARKLGCDVPPEGVTLEGIQALISLVHDGGMAQ